MSTMSDLSGVGGSQNPMGESFVLDGGLAGVNLYGNSAPIETVPMGDYMGEDAPATPAPTQAPAKAPAADEGFSIGSAVTKPGVLVPALIGAVAGWFLSKEEDVTEKAKCAAGLGAAVGLGALVAAWFSSK